MANEFDTHISESLLDQKYALEDKKKQAEDVLAQITTDTKDKVGDLQNKLTASEEYVQEEQGNLELTQQTANAVAESKAKKEQEAKEVEQRIAETERIRQETIQQLEVINAAIRQKEDEYRRVRNPLSADGVRFIFDNALNLAENVLRLNFNAVGQNLRKIWDPREADIQLTASEQQALRAAKITTGEVQNLPTLRKILGGFNEVANEVDKSSTELGGKKEALVKEQERLSLEIANLEKREQKYVADIEEMRQTQEKARDAISSAESALNFGTTLANSQIEETTRQLEQVQTELSNHLGELGRQLREEFYKGSNFTEEERKAEVLLATGKNELGQPLSDAEKAEYQAIVERRSTRRESGTTFPINSEVSVAMSLRRLPGNADTVDAVLSRLAPELDIVISRYEKLKELGGRRVDILHGIQEFGAPEWTVVMLNEGRERIYASHDALVDESYDAAIAQFDSEMHEYEEELVSKYGYSVRKRVEVVLYGKKAFNSADSPVRSLADLEAYYQQLQDQASLGGSSPELSRETQEVKQRIKTVKDALKAKKKELAKKKTSMEEARQAAEAELVSWTNKELPGLVAERLQAEIEIIDAEVKERYKLSGEDQELISSLQYQEALELAIELRTNADKWNDVLHHREDVVRAVAELSYDVQKTLGKDLAKVEKLSEEIQSLEKAKTGSAREKKRLKLEQQRDELVAAMVANALRVESMKAELMPTELFGERFSADNFDSLSLKSLVNGYNAAMFDGLPSTTEYRAKNGEILKVDGGVVDTEALSRDLDKEIAAEVEKLEKNENERKRFEREAREAEAAEAEAQKKFRKSFDRILKLDPREVEQNIETREINWFTYGHAENS